MSSSFDFAPHMDRVFDKVGRKNAVQVKNYIQVGVDSRDEPEYGSSIASINNPPPHVSYARAEGGQPDNTEHGFEHQYDVAVYFSNDVDIYESQPNRRPSKILINGTPYTVRQLDEHQGMTVVGANRDRRT